MPAEPYKARELFLHAVGKLPPEQWDGYVSEASEGDADLEKQVRRFLQVHRDSGSFLEWPADPMIGTVTIREALGTTIGPYKLLEQIGEGGFGVVFMAEQQLPVRRKVALKIIKPGMDTRQVIARFEAERQALALMDHPNIAKVLDAGTIGESEPEALATRMTEPVVAHASGSAGRPYFVMELVKGIPITEYCDQAHLDTRERLKLFAQVCQAVQHAHQKGIIHRDIKPSNVLVTLHDGVPVPKVIDFGVAKATGEPLTDKSLFTGFAQMVGTPMYMSPEQAGLSDRDVDTRSDIYSLGVLLYELLTGSTPFDKARFKEAGYDEMRRIIREEEPPKPSTRLSTLGMAATTVSTQRRSDPRKLSQLFRGELDWIVMKCLEKDRNRRYESANGLAADVQRYLADEPVQACPPSSWYRLKKFTLRNKGRVIAGGLLALALLAGSVGTTIGLVEARRQRDAAEAAAETEKTAKETAETRETETRAVLDFMENKVFAAARPENQEGGLGHDATLRRALEAALPFVEKSFSDQPRIEARLRMTLGKSFRYLGENSIAAEQFEAARKRYTQHFGSDHPATLRSMNDLAISYASLGRHTEALKLREETLALQEAKLGPHHPDTLGSMNNLALSYAELGRHAEALKLREETLALMNARMPEHEFTRICLIGLANDYFRLGRYAEAVKLHEEMRKLREAKLGPEHPETLRSMSDLADSYAAIGRHRDALALREKTLALHKAKLGPEHPETLKSMSHLAISYSEHGRHDEALKLKEETLTLKRGKLGPDHPDTLRSMNNLASSYHRYGRNAEALKLFEDTLPLMEAKLGRLNPVTLTIRSNLAMSYAALGRHNEALTLREESLAIRRATLGLDHPDTLNSMLDLISSYAKIGRPADADKLGKETVELAKAKLGPDHPFTLTCMNNLAALYGDLGQHAEALKLNEQTLALRKAKLGPDHPDTIHSVWAVAKNLSRVDRGVEALPYIDECLKRGTSVVSLPNLIRDAVYLRLRHFEKSNDAAECRATADMWENLMGTDSDTPPEKLYVAARIRAVTAGVVRTNENAEAADDEADRAMAWLTQAVAAGYNDVANMKNDKALVALRDREDLKMLITELEGRENE